MQKTSGHFITSREASRFPENPITDWLDEAAIAEKKQEFNVLFKSESIFRKKHPNVWQSAIK
jgi:hypothetical protein